jgi:hypothetical protein
MSRLIGSSWTEASSSSWLRQTSVTQTAVLSAGLLLIRYSSQPGTCSRSSATSSSRSVRTSACRGWAVSFAYLATLDSEFHLPDRELHTAQTGATPNTAASTKHSSAPAHSPRRRAGAEPPTRTCKPAPLAASTPTCSSWRPTTVQSEGLLTHAGDPACTTVACRARIPRARVHACARRRRPELALPPVRVTRREAGLVVLVVSGARESDVGDMAPRAASSPPLTGRPR